MLAAQPSTAGEKSGCHAQALCDERARNADI